MDDEDRRLHIIAMCPRELADYLLRETDKFSTYAAARAEIVEHIARTKRSPGALGLEQADHGAELNAIDKMEDLDDEERSYIASLESIGADHQQSVLAMVRNSKLKAKGKGKGKKGEKNQHRVRFRETVRVVQPEKNDRMRANEEKMKEISTRAAVEDAQRRKTVPWWLQKRMDKRNSPA